MNFEPVVVTISDNNASLSFEVQRREDPDSTEYWGGNWMVTHVHATVPGFRADFTTSLHLRELVEFREQVQQMRSTLSGNAKLEAMEGWLLLKAEMDKLGHVLWSVELTYPTPVGARLLFEIANDQTYLPDLLNQLDAVLETFPIVGRVL